MASTSPDLMCKYKMSSLYQTPNLDQILSLSKWLSCRFATGSVFLMDRLILHEIPFHPHIELAENDFGWLYLMSLSVNSMIISMDISFGNMSGGLLARVFAPTAETSQLLLLTMSAWSYRYYCWIQTPLSTQLTGMRVIARVVAVTWGRPLFATNQPNNSSNAWILSRTGWTTRHRNMYLMNTTVLRHLNYHDGHVACA